jgi:hypothetical protein
MEPDTFELLERARETGGAAGGFEFLSKKFLEEKNYPSLFETRLMQKRLELGLDPLQIGSLDEVPAAVRPAYERAFIDAAREVGGLFLADGDVARAWPYYRAIGEVGPVAAAIEQAEPGEEMDSIIAIAYQERVHPRKGFELILQQYGICRAITCFEQFPGPVGRDESLHLLLRTLYDELAASLRHAIERREEKAPESHSVAELIEGRDWLFENNSYYIDSSHLISVLRFSLDVEDKNTLRLAAEMAAYGQKLSPMFEYKVDPPFENVYTDHAIYLRALMGEDVDAAIAHFRRKAVESDPERVGTAPAQVLITLLVRLDRLREAIAASIEFLDGVPAAQLGCPTLFQLCQMAGEWDQLRELARERGDVLSFAASLLSQPAGVARATESRS